MRLKVISAYNEKFREISDLSFPTIESFCAKNNFDCERVFIEDFDKPPSWFKIQLFIKEIHTNKYDYLLWIDADAIILNEDFDIKSIINKEKTWHVSRDSNNINCGVMLWKSSAFSSVILNKIWSMNQKYLNHIWWEQAAMIELLEENFKNINEHTEFLEQSIFNAYEIDYYGFTDRSGQINKNSFICHFPSLAMGTRIKLIKKYRNVI